MLGPLKVLSLERLKSHSKRIHKHEDPSNKAVESEQGSKLHFEVITYLQTVLKSVISAP